MDIEYTPQTENLFLGFHFIFSIESANLTYYFSSPWVIGLDLPNADRSEQREEQLPLEIRELFAGLHLSCHHSHFRVALLIAEV